MKIAKYLFFVPWTPLGVVNGYGSCRLLLPNFSWRQCHSIVYPAGILYEVSLLRESRPQLLEGVGGEARALSQELERTVSSFLLHFELFTVPMPCFFFWKLSLGVGRWVPWQIEASFEATSCYRRRKALCTNLLSEKLLTEVDTRSREWHSGESGCAYSRAVYKYSRKVSINPAIVSPVANAF